MATLNNHGYIEALQPLQALLCEVEAPTATALQVIHLPPYARIEMTAHGSRCALQSKPRRSGA